MKELFISFLIFPFFMVNAQQKSLDSYFNELDPEIGVAFQLMNRQGEVLFSKDDTVTVSAASTIKIPILIAYYVALETRLFKAKNKYKLHEDDKVGGSGDLQYANPMSNYTYDELALEMIRVSDNTATNIMIDKIGMENVNKMLEFYGLQKTKLRRKMMDFEAVLEGKQNTTTASEMNQLLLLILNGKLVKPKYHESMIKKLLACEDYTTFAAKLHGVPIAHKTGTLDYIRADVGIIYGKEPLILSVFVQNFESHLQAEAILADIAEIVYLNY
jgi:beta-lactamase class A